MKYLNKFIEYLKESKEELDLDLVINDLLVPIKHLGVKITHYKSVVTTGLFTGYNKTSLHLNINHLKKADDNYDIIDSRIWELLDEIIQFKNIIDEDNRNKISISLLSTRIEISIFNKIDEDNSFLIQKLYDNLTKYWNGKLEFDNKKESLVVYVNGTKRIFENYIKLHEIDLSKFNINIREIEESDGGYHRIKSKLKIIITVR